jgi:hypothetical protein
MFGIEDYETLEVVQVGKRSSIGVVVRLLDEKQTEFQNIKRTKSSRIRKSASAGSYQRARCSLINSGVYTRATSQSHRQMAVAL